MKRKYVMPWIHIQNIESEDFLDESIQIHFSTNSDDEILITDGSEILVNKNTVWEE